jgi:hypothetical protein
LTKSTQSLKQTTQLIVDILSFETSNEVLKQKLSDKATDWDRIVTVASEHLVLPAIYCRLRQKSLLDLLPEDLVLYLEELTQLNRDRNHTLLSEVEDISKLFRTHQIQYVFIKGTAILVGNYYKDIGERMIGDIDILVASNHLDNAFDLLVNAGYSQFLPFNYEVKNYRHRPRQISNKRIGAVELHDQLLKYNYNHLIDKDLFLSSKETVRDIPIPNTEMLIWNGILAQQINDRCYYYNTLKLKGLYDAFVLELPQKEQIMIELYNQKYGLGFLNLVSVFCPSIIPSKQTIVSRFKKQTYQLSLSLPVLGNLLLKLKSVYIGIKDRLKLLFLNKSYRVHILKTKLNKWFF